MHQSYIICSLLAEASHLEARAGPDLIPGRCDVIAGNQRGFWGCRRPAALAPRSPAPGLHLRTFDEVRRFARAEQIIREGLADFCTRLCCSGWASARAVWRPKPNLRKCPRCISTTSLSVYVWSRCYTSCTVCIYTTWAPARYKRDTRRLQLGAGGELTPMDPRSWFCCSKLYAS